ncbi:MAG TPA: hypothetical protein PLY73_03225 [Candidatus Ozemobacteraceae bacterium]|nr:hypothetical protein [Candidatus Ozemobacteraceae bacterium]
MPFSRLPVLLLLFLTIASVCRAAWPTDIQLIVTGNLAGNIAALSEDGKITPAGCWSVPELIRKLRLERHASSLVIGVGNDADFRSPLSIAGGGSVERDWANGAGIDVLALGPSDLAACGTARSIPGDLLRRIWTNVSTAHGDQVFPGWKRTRISNRSITIASLISRSRLADVPLSRWRQLVVEPPLHALHRMRAQAPDSDLKILVCHLDDGDFADLAGAARADELLLRVSPEAGTLERPAGFEKPPAGPETHIVGNGSRSLLVIRRYSAESGRTDVEVRRLPLGKMRTAGISAVLSSAASTLHRPLRVITTRECSDPPPYAPRAEAHAGIVRRVMRADIALVADADGASWFRDRVVTPLSVVSAFNNKRLRLYNLPGSAVRQLFFRLLHGSFPRGIGSDGIALSLSSGMPKNLVINGHPLDERTVYKVAVSEDLFDDPSVVSILGGNDISENRGMTLWDAWIGELPQLPRPFELVR